MRNINISEIRPGMTLARTIINDNMIVVLAENTLLSEAHITRLKFLGIESLYIKDDYDLNPRELLVQSMLNRSNGFVAEYKEVLIVVEKLFKEIANDKDVPVKKMKKLVNDTIVPMVRQSGVIDYLYELKSMDNSTYNHSLRVAILAGVLAKWLEYEEAAIQDVIFAGFLHDIGKTQLDQKIIEKNIENLSDEEKEIYIQHPIEGNKIVSNNANLSEGVKRAVLQHHEKVDGTGFPFNLLGDDIHDYAKIVAVANTYDNITTEREGFLKQTPFSALVMITKGMFDILDPRICMPFVMNVQQAFIGSTILLSDKTKGQIIQYPKDYAALPLVKLDTGVIIDLNKEAALNIIEYNPA
ncbi:HD-GYP domain-containing protein [Anaerosinus massiliensis]|uniref:HD-GYP domain-containing protein n=1 Tax=Massilibacillus massiliensis TaxID=1806837 RepID=UPI000DA62AE7|nr:HD domain-containing phosphohydrolase [Massilibacillus massiliensis]